MRFIHAAREFRPAWGPALHTIALYTSGEPQAMFVREADESVEIASSTSNPYLDYRELERALDEALRWQGQLPGFGHSVYTEGDPRFPVLYELFEELARESHFDARSAGR